MEVVLLAPQVKPSAVVMAATENHFPQPP